MGLSIESVMPWAMKAKTSKVLQIVVLALGAIQVLVGITFWAKLNIPELLYPVHMLIGLAIVILLWVAAGVAGKAGLGWKRVTVAVVWGVITIAYGILQGNFFEGNFEHVARALHLLVGLGAIGLAHMLFKKSAGVTNPVVAEIR